MYTTSPTLRLRLLLQAHQGLCTELGGLIPGGMSIPKLEKDFAEEVPPIYTVSKLFLVNPYVFWALWESCVANFPPSKLTLSKHKCLVDAY